MKLYDATHATLAEVMAGEPAYRVDQVWSGLYKQFQEVGQITTISAALREKLATALPTSCLLYTSDAADE